MALVLITGKPALTHFIRLTILAALSLASTTNLVAQQATGDDKANAAELAKKLQNPVADLISVPYRTTGILESGRRTRCASPPTFSR